MKFSVVAFSAVVAAVSFLATPVTAGAMADCGEQSDCIRIVFGDEQEPSLCDDAIDTCEATGCEFQVCLTLEFNGGAADNTRCVKDYLDDTTELPDTISHSCIKAENQCSDCALFGDDSTSEVDTGLEDEHTQCQTVSGGGTATFLLKDGNGCTGSSGQYPPCDPVTNVCPTAIATCLPTEADPTDTDPPIAAEDSCTGNSAGVECVWTVTAPVCGDDSTQAPAPEYKCPRGKNVCYTTDCACIIGSCKGVKDTIDLSDLGIIISGDGDYTFPTTCPNGKALSNTVDFGDVCVKTEEGEFPTTLTVVGGEWVPFSMKCGNDCYLVAPEGTTFESLFFCN